MTKDWTRRIYLLDRQKLSPEVIAVTFAKTSRSPLSFSDIAADLTHEGSAQFHEKWVVGYGHASVAEHAVLHIAFENVSRLAIECIESNRLASYTEKSTRYQRWDPGSYYIPEEILSSPYEVLYRDTCDRLLSTYHDSLLPVREVIRKANPLAEGETEGVWERRYRSHYIDACRFLLPAASFANVGMTVNARALEYAISKMLSHPLDEVRQIGEAVKVEAQKEIPTLVKYVEPDPSLQASRETLHQQAQFLPSEVDQEPIHLIDFDPEAEDRILAAALYHQSTCSFETAMEYIQSQGEERRLRLAKAILGGLDLHAAPPRLLEHAVYTVDALLDQGAYFELKRHRMMTQSPQPLTTDLGYAIPRIITEAGFQPHYQLAMDAAADAYQKLAPWNHHVAAYLVPNGFNRRVLLTLNLRQAYHLCELRSAPNAHFSMRRFALFLAEIIRDVHPILADYMRLPEGEDWRQVEIKHFARLA